MNLLVINLDKGIFLPGSASLERLKDYSRLVDKIFVIVWTEKKEQPIIFQDRLFVYSTDSRFKLLYFLDTIRIFRDIKKNNKIDLIFTQDPFETGLIGWLIARKNKIPLQLQIHTDFLNPYFWKESLLNKIRVMLAKFLIPRADCIRVVSERIKNSLLRVTCLAARRARCPLCVATLPIFVDIKKIQAAPIKTDLRQKYPHFNFIILMASRLTAEKNIILAISAMTKIVKKFSKIGLIILGSGPKEQNLKLKIKNLKLSDNVVLEPWTNDIVSYYKTADLFLITSNYEGYGMSLVEAAAARRKIISSDVGIADEILERENIFKTGDQKDLENKLERAIKDEIKPPRMVKAKSKEEYLQEYKKSWELCLRKKICYVLPKYDEKDHTHFSHIHNFIRELSKRADIFLFIEKADSPVETELTDKIYVSKSRFRNIFDLLKIRFLGYRDFYIHYSFLSALNASLITSVFGGKVFYWNCGLPWQYEKPFLREFFEGLVYKMVSFLVTGTDSLAREYAKNYHIDIGKIKIMPNWISLENFSPPPDKIIDDLKKELGISGGEKIMLFLHRLSKRKGAHLLPRIFGEVRAFIPEVKLIIIGDGPEREVLEKEFSREISEKIVIFLGWVANRKVPKYYALADIFLMPSEEEGFPRVILEAMAVGLPFAAFDIGGVKEIIPPDFYTNAVRRGQVGEFISLAKKALLMTKEERLNWKKTAHNWVSRFQTEKVAEIFLEMYD